VVGIVVPNELGLLGQPDVLSDSPVCQDRQSAEAESNGEFIEVLGNAVAEPAPATGLSAWPIGRDSVGSTE
jgi:hypothetical protein